MRLQSPINSEKPILHSSWFDLMTPLATKFPFAYPSTFSLFQPDIGFNHTIFMFWESFLDWWGQLGMGGMTKIQQLWRLLNFWWFGLRQFCCQRFSISVEPNGSNGVGKDGLHCNTHHFHVCSCSLNFHVIIAIFMYKLCFKIIKR